MKGSCSQVDVGYEEVWKCNWSGRACLRIRVICMDRRYRKRKHGHQ